jgi:hypothetical protein
MRAADVLTGRPNFAPIGSVKFSLLSILAAITIASGLSACNTLANRRDFYAPSKPEGPYTDQLQHKRVSETADKHGGRVWNHGPE